MFNAHCIDKEADKYHFDCELYSSYLITVINEVKIVERQFIFGKVKNDNLNRFEKDRRIFTSIIQKIITTSDDIFFVCTLNSIYKIDSLTEISIPADYLSAFKYLVIYHNASPLEFKNHVDEFEYKIH